MKKTLENLAKAFIGESQARNRYTIYSKIAKNEGFPQIAQIFLETADNERVHAKWIFRMIQKVQVKTGEHIEAVTVEAEAPLIMGLTAANLKSAIAGEHYENSEMYPEFAEVAEQDGFEDIADRLLAIGHAEEHHEERYIRLLEEVEAGTFYKKEEPVYWNCSKCGYVYHGEEPPEVCPACNHPRKYFQMVCEKY